MSNESRRRERSSSSSTSASTDYTTSPSPSSSYGSDQQQTWRKGHYRGITFDDILPPHMITNAPPPDAAADGKQKQKQKQKQKRGGHSTPERHSLPAPSTMTMDQSSPRPPSAKRNYPSGKKPPSSGGGAGGRMRATARALVRGLSVVKMKRNSGGRSGYEAV